MRGCLQSPPSTTNSSLSDADIMHSTAQVERRVQCGVPRGSDPKSYTSKMQKKEKKKWDWRRHTSATNKGKSRAGERGKLGEWKTDVPSCTPQNFRSLTSLSQAVLARLRRRREASSAHCISAYSEILWQRGRGRAVHTFAELFCRSQEVGGDAFLYRKVAVPLCSHAHRQLVNIFIKVKFSGGRSTLILFWSRSIDTAVQIYRCPEFKILLNYLERTINSPIYLKNQQ